MSHYASILSGYAVALLLWFAALRAFPKLWPKRSDPNFQQPRQEIGFALLACVAILCIGQLYLRGWLLPKLGTVKPLTETVNQALIFSPIAVLLFFRKHALGTAWLPTDSIWTRVLSGLVLGNIAIVAYVLARDGAASWPHVVVKTYDPRNLPLLAQVLFEDVTIAVLFVRLSAGLGTKPSIAVVGLLFAAGHIPTMLTEGASAGEFARLLLDAGLAMVAVSVLRRSADVWWFWGVHYAMDMMQFHGAVD